MSDLIHKIVGKIIEVGQSDTTKFRLGEIIRYTPSEILEILKQHENEIFGEESSTQTNTSNTLNALNCIDRQMAIDAVCMEWCNVKHQNCEHPFDAEKDDYYWCDGCETALRTLPDLPSAQPESCDGCKWEYAFGYGECHHCKRSFNDMYKRGEQDE